MNEISDLVDRLIGRNGRQREVSYELVTELLSLLDSEGSELTEEEAGDVHDFLLDDLVCAALVGEMEPSDGLSGDLLEIFFACTPDDEDVLAKMGSENPLARKFCLLAFMEESTGDGDDSLARLIMDSDYRVREAALMVLPKLTSAEVIIASVDGYREDIGDDDNFDWFTGILSVFLKASDDLENGVQQWEVENEVEGAISDVIIDEQCILTWGEVAKHFI